MSRSFHATYPITLGSARAWPSSKFAAYFSGARSGYNTKVMRTKTQGGKVGSAAPLLEQAVNLEEGQALADPHVIG